MTTLEKHYDQGFYADQIPDSLRSARIVLGTLFEHYRPSSMLDLGCGQGTWLAAAEELGVKELHGLDGPWVDRSALIAKAMSFTPVNMEVDIPLERRFDLALSVEVAEHLSDRRAASVVETLCRASDVVMFGAAVIGQGGENHVNEQRQSYWAAHFQAQGYRCFDVLRPRVWGQDGVAPWYRQNTLVYVNQRRGDLIEIFSRIPTPAVLDMIHPEMFERRVASYRETMRAPSLRLCLGMFKSFLTSKLGSS